MSHSVSSKHKVQMTVRLEPEVEKAATAFSRRTGIPVSVVVADAAKQVLVPQPDDCELSLEQATERILRRLSKVDTALRADLNELRETAALAVRTYLNHTPAIPESERPAASMSGRIRFDRFVNLLDQNLRDGVSILNTENSHHPTKPSDFVPAEVVDDSSNSTVESTLLPGTHSDAASDVI